MSVDRCICHQWTFAELAARARERSCTLDQLMMDTACGTRCGLCLPYLKLMLVTGKTRFPVMSDAKAELMLRQAERQLSNSGNSDERSRSQT